MQRSLTILISLVALASVLAGISLPLRAQQAADSVPPRDTVFTEIELTNEGVNAVDTAGNYWTYDFDKGSFVPDKSVVAQTTRSGEGRRVEEAAYRAVEERCTQEKIVKPFQKSVVVGYDEYVSAGFIAYGQVIVKGWVKGDVQSISGRVLVTASGQVDGNVKAPEIVVNSGGKVSGQQITTDALDFPTEVLQRSFSVDGLVIVLGFLLFLLVTAFLVTTLFPIQFGNLKNCMLTFRVRSVFVGLLFLLLLPLIIILVSITIIGIAVVPFIPMAYVLAMACGVTALGSAIGETISGKILGGSKNRMIHALIGVPVFMLLWVFVAVLLGSTGVAYGFGIFFLVVSIVVSLYPVLGGIGAALLTRFGYREHTGIKVDHRRQASEAPTPAPPPIPEMPRFVTPPPPVSPVPQPPQLDQPPDKFGPYGPNSRPPLSPNS
jgi:hypothetical protein